MGLHFVPFPGLSSFGDLVLGECTLRRWAVHLITFLVPASGFPGCAWERHLRCAMCLLWGANPWLRPSWQLSTVRDPRKYWLATGSLRAVWWRMPFLGPRFPLIFQLWLLPACLSAPGGGWASLQPASSPLVFTQSFFCERAWQCLKLELFAGKFSLSLFFYLSGYPTVWVAILC